jgi:hypothetical protein
MNEGLVILHFNIVTGIDEGKGLVTGIDEDVTGTEGNSEFCNPYVSTCNL